MLKLCRIKDSYNWKTLRHWRIAAETGCVRLRMMQQEELSDELLGRALQLLKNDCFPIAMLCRIDKEQEKHICLTSLWAGIFSFLDNKRSIRIAEEDIYFEKLADDDQKLILDAHIASIWMKAEEVQ